jgi:hypothetical protein
MAGKDIIMLSRKELKRLHIIHKVLDKAIKQVEAAKLLSLSTRQIRRVVKRVKGEGEAGITHKSRGKPSGRRLPEETKDKAIRLYRGRYKGFGPTLASEKLFEIEGIKINDETLRKWLIESGDWKRNRKRRVHRQWRERKDYFGEMIQMDGSHHDWFEGRGSECVFMGYIDDATGNTFGSFYSHEGTIPAMDSFKHYIKKYGIPVSVYLDKHTTYKSTAKPSIEDELNNTRPLSEFERALKELAVDVIHANSPQAKGRIERHFRTLQDRLIKEMRLRGIRTTEEGNKFLGHYLPRYNRRFAVKPKGKDDLHREIPKGLNLDKILCIRTERALRNDFTIAHNRKLYQIMDNVRTKKVVVEERIDGSMLITHKDTNLRYKEIPTRPEKEQKQPYIFIPRKRNIYTPRADHPWRKFKLSLHSNNYKQKELTESQI